MRSCVNVGKVEDMCQCESGQKMCGGVGVIRQYVVVFEWLQNVWEFGSGQRMCGSLGVVRQYVVVFEWLKNVGQWSENVW